MKLFDRIKLSTMTQLLPEIDRSYYQYIDKYYTSRDLSDRYLMLLYILCAHQNIDKLHHWLACNVNYRLDYTLPEIFSSIFPHNMIDDLTDISIEHRKRNAKHVNYHQMIHLDNLNNKVHYKTTPDGSNYVPQSQVIDLTRGRERLKLSRRTLTLYFRRESIEEGEHLDHTVQMDYFEFSLICYTINQYITRNKSSVFTDIRIVSREPELYPHYVHVIAPEVYYSESTGVDFVVDCCVGANTIHFTHASVPDVQAGSIPIYCNGMLIDTDRIEDEHVRMNLTYNNNNTDDLVNYNSSVLSVSEAYNQQPELNIGHDINHIVTETISGVVALERKLCCKHET